MSTPRTVFRTEWFAVEEEDFGGTPHYRITSPDGVIVLATTERDEVLLIRQFRPAIREWTLEFPCGGIDPGESPDAAARRELYEETGYVCRELVPIGQGRVQMNRHAAREFAFFGTGARRDPAFEPKEDIEVMLVRPGEFKELVRAGRFQQLAALGVVLLLDWNLGRRLLAP